MNILWISHFLPYPPKGGALQRSYNLIKEVSKKHHLYLVALVRKDFSTICDIDIAYEELKKICQDVKLINININAKFLALRSLLSPYPYTASWLYSKEVYYNLKEISKDDFDLVHIDSIDLGKYSILFNNFPKVLNHHNIESSVMLNRFIIEKNIFKKMYFFIEYVKLKKYEKVICPKFDCNIVVSTLDKERLLNICPLLKVEVIPNGVDIEYFSPKSKNYIPNTLVFVGGMNWHPNRDAMIFFCKEIWPMVKNRWPKAQAFIIGIDPPKYVVELSKKDRDLVVTGFVDDVRPYIEKAHVYICPIREGGGTKLKILDALAMEKPVIAHPVAIEGIELVPEKHVLTAKRPEEFIAQIERLFNNKNLCDYIAKKGREFVSKKYNFKKIGIKLAKLYCEICG